MVGLGVGGGTVVATTDAIDVDIVGETVTDGLIGAKHGCWRNCKDKAAAADDESVSGAAIIALEKVGGSLPTWAMAEIPSILSSFEANACWR